MDLYTAMLAAALHFATVWTNPTTGERDYVKWCRAPWTPTGQTVALRGNEACVARLEWSVSTLLAVSMDRKVDPWLLLALAMTESRLDPRARSRIGAFGLLQLNPRAEHGKEAKRICRKMQLDQRSCDVVAADIGARVIRDYLAMCNGHRSGVYAFRTGDCGFGPYSNKTVERANQMRRLWQKQQQVLIDSSQAN